MAWVNLLDVVYPVGSVYLSTLSTSPASIVGGSWTQMTGGMLGLAGSTGVAASGGNGGSLTISVNQLPAHSHYFDSLSRYNVTGSGHAAVGSDDYSSYGDKWHQNQYQTSKIGGGRRLYSCALFCLWLEKNQLVILAFMNLLPLLEVSFNGGF